MFSDLPELMVLLHLFGALAAVDSIFTARTPQGAIAWAFSLFFFPAVFIPIYLVFGRRRFHGYKRVSRKMLSILGQFSENHREDFADFDQTFLTTNLTTYKSLEAVAGSQFLGGNSVMLLPTGKEFFEHLIADIRGAQREISFCFYIIRNDRLGTKIQKELIGASKRGVEVRFLYDTIGSIFLSSEYLSELRDAGVKIFDFNTRRGYKNFFQINFRNHRKIVVIDHEVAYTGGFNVGDEYVGHTEEFGHWRDTQVRVTGPVVTELEVVFASDWAWASGEKLEFQNHEPIGGGTSAVLAVPTGPIDDRDRCILFFQQLISSARERLWIATPYFVPEEAIFQSIRLAAIRGVDVRILIPEKTDNPIVELAADNFLPSLSKEGAKILRYAQGFLHEKVILVDDHLSTVGSVNFDSRSMRSAFEITLAFACEDFAKRMEAMFLRDFEHSRLLKRSEVEKLPLHRKIGAKIARLFSPVL